MSKVDRIRLQNDLLRTTFLPFAGRVVLTQGVATHPLREDVITAVREFTAFTQDNDPHGEHDFGGFEVAGERFFFKIDYYSDDSYTYGADPQAGPVKRVLTIMQASEY